MTITRNPPKAAKKTYDLIIVGGGIYGIMLAFEASRRGLSTLLLEKNDFGSATSFNSLKTIHGGLRHLQKLNLKLYYQFVKERQWFLQTFPDFVKPLPVLMPLYGDGLRRPGILGQALFLDKLLSAKWNNGFSSSHHLPGGEILPVHRVKEIFPLVNLKGLKGGAQWYDACMPDNQRLLIEILRNACQQGARALNYMEAVNISKENHKVTGVLAVDLESHKSYHFHSTVVVNCTGPWARKTAALFDQDFPELFRSSIAWNILFNRKALSTHALAVAPPKSGGQIFFLHPWKGMLLAGTGHASRKEVTSNPQLSDDELSYFIEDLNSAIPSLKLKKNEILHVFCGYLPVTQEGSTHLTRNDIILDHQQHNGPKGLFSVSGVKYTASRLVAEKVLRNIFPHQKVLPDIKSQAFISADNGQKPRGIFEYHWLPPQSNSHWREEMLNIIREESVQHLDDLILRRTNLGDNPVWALQIAPLISELFEWDKVRSRAEIFRLREHFKHNQYIEYNLP